MSVIHRPEIWRDVLIGDVCLEVDRVDPRKRDATTFRYVDISSVDNELKAIVEPSEVESSEAPSRARQLIAENDVLVSTVRPNLNAVALVPAELDGEICSTGFCVLRANRDLIVPEFLFLWVRSPEFVQRIIRYARGIGYPAVSDGDVLKVRIPLPPLPEQERIVALLRHADWLRQMRRESDDKVAEFLSSLFYYTFLGDRAELNTKGAESLGNLTSFITSGPRGWAEYYSDQGGKFIRVQNVLENKLDFEDLALVRSPDNSDKERATVQPGDLLITITGTVGRVAVAPDNIGEAYVSQHVAIARPNGSLSPDYMAAFLNHSHGGQRQIAQQNYGQTKPGLNLSQIGNFQIPLPSQTALHFYTNTAACFRAAYEGLTGNSVDFDGLFQSLLTRAFTGELTEEWREAHRDELEVAAAERDALLGIERTVSAEEPARIQTTLHPRRKRLIEALTRRQRFLLDLINEEFQADRYVTAESLVQEHDLNADDWSLRDVHEALTLFEQAALIQRIRVAYAPSDTTHYVPAQRFLIKQQDEANDLVKFVDWDAIYR